MTIIRTESGFERSDMFIAALIFTALLDAVLLELSKHTVIGWITSAIVLIRLVISRRIAVPEGSWSKSRAFGNWAATVILLLFSYGFSAPPIRQVPVFDSGVPDITGVVHVAQGDLTGVYNSDHTVRIYAGIPYAMPPTDELRWREPRNPASWSGVRHCDTFAPMAMQPRGSTIYNSLTRILGYHDYRISLHDNYLPAMSEDCLYLNIFCPEEASGEPLPVLFYIHGGSLTTGHSWNIDYRGDDLAKRGIIVVNFGYRLGLFGYFANEALAAESPDGTTGNYGLLDQIQALTWVRENIASFGGDPEQITIAGESAGASSVNALCASPLTDGMFVRAIAQSSGIVADKPYHTLRPMEEALEAGRALMAEMGAADIKDMRSLPAEQLLNTETAQDAMTIDGYALLEMPGETYKKGQNHEQALLNGFNAREADVFLLDTRATAENYVGLLEPIFGRFAQEAAALVPAGSIAQKQRFIIDRGGEAKGALNYLYSAAWFTYSHHLWSSFLIDEGRPVYEYCFTRKNRSLSNYHGGELPYVFGNLWRHPGVYDRADEVLSRQMQQLWVNFVKTGDPNSGGLPLWEPREENSEHLLRLDEEPRIIDDPYLPVYAILDRYQEEDEQKP